MGVIVKIGTWLYKTMFRTVSTIGAKLNAISSLN